MINQKIEDSKLPVGFIAESLGVPEMTLYRYRTGRQVPSDEFLSRLAEFLSARGAPCTVDELKAGERRDYRGPGRPSTKKHRQIPIRLRLVPIAIEDSDEELYIMRVEALIAAGGITTEEPPLDGESLEVPRSFLGRGARGLHLVKVVGWSMEDARIHDGDYLILKPADRAEDQEVVVVRIGDGVTLKRYRDTDGPPRLQADSQHHDDIPITGEIVVLARVWRVVHDTARPGAAGSRDRPQILKVPRAKRKTKTRK